MLPKTFFVTGTDTGVGKTFISALLMVGLAARYWKPIQTGANSETDTQWIQRITEFPSSQFFPETYCFQAPLSPHLAAAMENQSIEMPRIQKPKAESLIIEGAGGVMVPLNTNHLMIDLIQQLQVPCLVVARSTLGTINHTLLTLEQLRSRRIPICGVILNGPKNTQNRQAIEQYGAVPVLAEIEPIPLINHEILLDLYLSKF